MHEHLHSRGPGWRSRASAALSRSAAPGGSAPQPGPQRSPAGSERLPALHQHQHHRLPLPAPATASPSHGFAKIHPSKARLRLREPWERAAPGPHLGPGWTPGQPSHGPRRAACAGPLLVLWAPRSATTRTKRAQTFHASRTAPPRPAFEEQRTSLERHGARAAPEWRCLATHDGCCVTAQHGGEGATRGFSWRLKWQEKEKNGKKPCVFSHCSGNLLWQHNMS